MVMVINITSVTMTVAVLECIINTSHAYYYHLLAGYLRAVCVV